MRKIIQKINSLKQEKNAIILAHSYQNIEIDEVADFVGRFVVSLTKSKVYKCRHHCVCRGLLHGSDSKIISPEKKVLLPSLNAGCLMADMINHDQMVDFKKKNPDAPVVCYINSTAEVKAECDICCTSSNAFDIVKSLNAPKVLFLPDANLGKWVERELDGVEVITYDGNCPVHNNITIEDIKEQDKNTRMPKSLSTLNANRK